MNAIELQLEDEVEEGVAAPAGNLWTSQPQPSESTASKLWLPGQE
jgi:hypothetical protein